MRLKELVGWNQTEADWTALMRMDPDGCWVAEIAGKTVATGTAVSYRNQVGWVGMILVDPDYRRQGIATRIMDRCIDYLSGLPCPCIKLDATDDGAKVYGNLGFVVEYSVERWKKAAGHAPRPASSLPARIRRGQLDQIAELDAEVFGTNRRKLLEYYVNSGYPGFFAGPAEAPFGYALGRPGTHSFQVGPMVCFDGLDSTAEALFDAMMAEAGDRAAIIDLIPSNAVPVKLASERGFSCIRVLQRMFLGPNQSPGRPGLVCALAGFEFG